jgi:hypothetical protein
MSPYYTRLALIRKRFGQHAADSEFTAKIQAHENQHSQDLVNGFDGHEFVTVAEFYARISTLTDPTAHGLVNKISQEYVQYMTDEGTELSLLLDHYRPIPELGNL